MGQCCEPCYVASGLLVGGHACTSSFSSALGFVLQKAGSDLTIECGAAPHFYLRAPLSLHEPLTFETTGFCDVTLCTRMYTGPCPLLLRLSTLSSGCCSGIVIVSPLFGLRLCRAAGRALLPDASGGCVASGC